MPIQLLLIGAEGKFGREISRIIEEEKTEFTLIGKVSSPLSKLGCDISPFLSQADVILDVSVPSSLEKNLPLIVQEKVPLVIGTTGHSQEQLARIEKASLDIPVLISPNFSLGIHILQSLLQKMPAGEYTIEERHHLHKKDKPSGTALLLKELLLGNIKLHSERIGDVIGDHKIILSLPHETISLSHTASSRTAFAYGALKACTFLYHKSKGLYTTFYD